MEKQRKEQANNSAALFTFFFSNNPFDFIARSFNMYENEDADQLCGKRATDQRLCFRLDTQRVQRALSPIGRIQILTTMFEEYGHAQTMVKMQNHIGKAIL